MEVFGQSSSNSQGVHEPKLRFPGFEGEWRDSKLSDLTTYLHTRGKAQKSHFISTENIKQNCSGIERYENDSITDGVAFERGDVLLANIRPYLKKLWLSSFSGVCSADVLAFHPTGVDSDFLYSALCRDAFFTYVMSGAKGSKMPRGDKLHIMDFELAVPGIQEQEKIAHFVQCLDKRIEKQRQLVEALKSYKRGALSKLFPQKGETAPKCRFAGFTEPWEQRNLGELGSVSMCKRIFKEQTSEKGDIPFYKIGTFGGTADSFISRQLFEEYKAKYSYPSKGTILISASGSIGRTVEFTGNDEYFQDSNIVWLTHDNRLDDTFLKYFYEVVEWIGIEGSTIKRLYNDNILKTKIVLPNTNEQRTIGNFFRNLDYFISAHQSKLKLLQELRSGLLQQMFI